MTGFWTAPIQCSPTTAHVPSAQASGIPSTGTWPLRKLSSFWSLPTLNLDSFFQEKKKKDLIGTASSSQWLFSSWVDCIFTQPCTKWTEPELRVWVPPEPSCGPAVLEWLGHLKILAIFFPFHGDFYIWLALSRCHISETGYCIAILN